VKSPENIEHNIDSRWLFDRGSRGHRLGTTFDSYVGVKLLLRGEFFHYVGVKLVSMYVG
jgi:hypothetical protein